MVRAAALAVGLAIIASSASAAPTWAEKVGSGQWITDTCDSRDDTNTFICYTYLRGLTDGQQGMAAAADHPMLYCLPVTFDFEVGRRIVAKYGKDNPQYIRESAGLLTTRALMATYPCEK